MDRIWIVLLGLLAAFIISLFFEEARDYYIDTFGYIVTFEWFSDIGEALSSSYEAITNIEESPLTNVWFWAFYAALMSAVWYFPSKFGLTDYTLSEKFLYTFIFFVVDWIIISHMQNN